MGVLASLIGFLIIFPCFLMGFTSVVKTVFRWRRDAHRYYDHVYYE